MKTVGIIGGLGPETTSKFYLEIISSCLKKNKNQRPAILIWSVPILLKVEEQLITKNVGEEKYLPLLIEAAKILEQAGANFLVMPCNTMHFFIEEIRNAINIPVLSIVEETVSIIKKRKISEVGILATSMTINKKLFKSKFNAVGIKEMIPNKKEQGVLDKVIHKLVLGKQHFEDKVEVDKVIIKMVRQGIIKIILACTDLQLIIKTRSDAEIFDTMKILADAAVEKINEEAKNC